MDILVLRNRDGLSDGWTRPCSVRSSGSGQTHRTGSVFSCVLISHLMRITNIIWVVSCLCKISGSGWRVETVIWWCFGWTGRCVCLLLNGSNLKTHTQVFSAVYLTVITRLSVKFNCKVCVAAVQPRLEVCYWVFGGRIFRKQQSQCLDSVSRFVFYLNLMLSVQLVQNNSLVCWIKCRCASNSSQTGKSKEAIEAPRKSWVATWVKPEAARPSGRVGVNSADALRLTAREPFFFFFAPKPRASADW